jgi:hypothetical protein
MQHPAEAEIDEWRTLGGAFCEGGICSAWGQQGGIHDGSTLGTREDGDLSADVSIQHEESANQAGAIKSHNDFELVRYAFESF